MNVSILCTNTFELMKQITSEVNHRVNCQIIERRQDPEKHLNILIR